MKTFSEFLNEGIDLGYACDTWQEAESLAISLGSTGAHEINGRYRPGLTPEDYTNLLYHIKKKKLVGACE